MERWKTSKNEIVKKTTNISCVRELYFWLLSLVEFVKLKNFSRVGWGIEMETIVSMMMFSIRFIIIWLACSLGTNHKFCVCDVCALCIINMYRFGVFELNHRDRRWMCQIHTLKIQQWNTLRSGKQVIIIGPRSRKIHCKWDSMYHKHVVRPDKWCVICVNCIGFWNFDINYDAACVWIHSSQSNMFCSLILSICHKQNGNTKVIISFICLYWFAQHWLCIQSSYNVTILCLILIAADDGAPS